MRTLLALGALALGCAAAAPRPRVLAETDSVRVSPALLEAAERAPQAYAHAEDLRRRAEAARESDPANAQILGEQALAAYEHAVVLARLVQAEARRGDTDARVARAETELKALETQERSVRAETDDLELRAKVITDTLPVAESGPASPEREQARREAARALALQARLLCASARLLEPTRPSLAALVAELDALAPRISKKGSPVPIDDAVRLRSRCLAELSQTRRAKTLAEPAHGSEDQLLSELSNAAYAPSRDDRGVVVTLRSIFARGAELRAAANATLQALGHAASSHPDFPILVVLHKASGRPAGDDQARLDTLVTSLKGAGAQRVQAELAGDAAPLVDPAEPGASERNERVEVVFVAPSTG